ncbi:hypothetical protein AJ87_26320 [Rhizobium yanglingense]|nr:hypothetical protein AJ87_26320 [Rhizobium yanglingense]
MNEGEIAERFIRAAEIDQMSERVGPKPLKAQSLQYLHTQADKNGWESERLAEERKDFWDGIGRRVSAREMSEADETRSWLRLVPNDSDRSALVNWSNCMAGDGIFKEWCFAIGIHPETGRRRKDRAIARILLALGRKPLQHNEIDLYGVLPRTPEISDKYAIVAEVAAHWRDTEAKPMACYFDTDLSGFSWADKQNERRRHREARRKQAA